MRSAALSEKPANVRIATPDDIEPLYWHLMNDFGPANSIPIPISERRVFHRVRALCTGQEGIAGVIDGPHHIIGSIGLGCVQPWFSEEWIAEQVWLFVTPTERHAAPYAKALFDFAEWHREDLSKRFGYDVVFENTVISFDRLEAKMRLWSRYGTQAGAIYWTRGRNGVQKQQPLDIDVEPSAAIS